MLSYIFMLRAGKVSPRLAKILFLMSFWHGHQSDFKVVAQTLACADALSARRSWASKKWHDGRFGALGAAEVKQSPASSG